MLTTALLAVVLAVPAQVNDPAKKSADARRLASAIDAYLKEVEAADTAAAKAKAAAAEKLITSYEATIKRSMRAGDVQGVEALQVELRDVKAEIAKDGPAPQSGDLAAFKAKLVAHPWYLYWDSKRGATDMPVVLRPDFTLTYANVVKTKDWPKTWAIEQRPVLLIAGNVLFLLPNGDLRGFFLGTGQPVGAVPGR